MIAYKNNTTGLKKADKTKVSLQRESKGNMNYFSYSETITRLIKQSLNGLLKIFRHINFDRITKFQTGQGV